MVELKAPNVNVELVSPTILVNVLLLEDDCHWIVPTFPESVNAFGVKPEQIAWFELAVPGTVVGLTVIVTTFEITEGQTPLLTTAWKYLVEDEIAIWATVKVALVAPVMLAQGPVDDAELCHWIDPVFPANVNTAGGVPWQIDWLALAVPATDGWFTVLVTFEGVADGQTPLVTIAW